MESRQSLAASRPSDNFLVAAIDWYQKQISPRKGRRCSHGVLHGGTGCSGYIKNAIQQHGWYAALPLARRRFRQCKLAAQHLRAQRSALPTAFAVGSPSQRRRETIVSESRDCFLYGAIESLLYIFCSCSPCN